MGHYDSCREEPSCEIEDTATWLDYNSELEESEMREDFEQPSLADLAEWDKLEDVVNHPKHYTSHPSGIECIQITEHLNFCLGSAVKYIWRCGLKTENPEEDLMKAIFYLKREIERINNDTK